MSESPCRLASPRKREPFSASRGWLRILWGVAKGWWAAADWADASGLGSAVLGMLILTPLALPVCLATDLLRLLGQAVVADVQRIRSRD
jgi:hypothetical protein